MKRLWLAFVVTVTVPLAAQPFNRPNAPAFRSEVRLQWYHFGNFFQATEGETEEDINAAGLEYRAAYRPWGVRTDVYGHLNFLNFDDPGRKNSYGGRLGVAHDGERHDFNVYLDRGENRITFDVGDTTDSANVTTLAGDYTFRVTKDWDLGAEARHERQRFDVSGQRENDFNLIGGSVRYRGFGYIFMPEVGFSTGSRDVVDGDESYDENAWYVEASSAPHRRVYVSARFRLRTREYTTGNPLAENFGQDDDRHQWTLSGSYKATERLTAILYYTNEDVNRSIPGASFGTDFLLLGLAYGF